MVENKLIIVTNNIVEERLDKLILQYVSDIEQWKTLTRSQIKRLIENHCVYINDKIAQKSGSIISSNSIITINFSDLIESEIKSYELPLKIYFEDKSLIVIEKPFGISVHPGAGEKSKTIVNALISHLKDDQFSEYFNDKNRPGVVHRLDKNTTGIIVLAKDKFILKELSSQFANRTVERKYTALVLSTPRKIRSIDLNDSGKIELNLGRDPSNRLKICVLDSKGRSAITNWKVLERMDYANLVEVKLETGRTHQIRVHFSHLLSPILGDPLYGNFDVLPKLLLKKTMNFGRQALHAKLLAFTHPLTKERLKFESDLPLDFKQLIQVFKEYKNNI